MSELNREPGKYEQLLLDNQLCFPLYAAARKVVNEYNPLLKPYGLTYTQYIVFLALWEKEEGKAPGQTAVPGLRHVDASPEKDGRKRMDQPLPLQGG